MPYARSETEPNEVYLDFNATTPVDERVVQAMLPFFTADFGNPASTQHSFGRRAKAAVDDARSQVAALIQAPPSSIIFTAGATESSNLLLKGICAKFQDQRRRIVMSTTEHKSVLEVGNWLAAHGFELSLVRCDSRGVLDLEALEDTLSLGDVLVVSIIAANNETGTLNPITLISEIVHDAGALFHTDATQLAGRLPFDAVATGVDAASFSAHKMYGPKGIGALFLGRGLKQNVLPLLHGGGQENGLRSGTSNVPGVVGFGEAATLALKNMPEQRAASQVLRDALHAALSAKVGPLSLNGHEYQRLPNTLNIRIHGAEADAVLANMSNIAAATGSACTSEVPSPSHVLTAMGLNDVEASQSIRFSLGRMTTGDDIETAVAATLQAVQRVRELSRADAI
ncbi:MAG: cysteine desulfurase family protein [Actinomycetota bacterium]